MGGSGGLSLGQQYPQTFAHRPPAHQALCGSHNEACGKGPCGPAPSSLFGTMGPTSTFPKRMRGAARPSTALLQTMRFGKVEAGPLRPPADTRGSKRVGKRRNRAWTQGSQAGVHTAGQSPPERASPEQRGCGPALARLPSPQSLPPTCDARGWRARRRARPCGCPTATCCSCPRSRTRSRRPSASASYRCISSLIIVFSMKCVASSSDIPPWSMAI